MTPRRRRAPRATILASALLAAACLAPVLLGAQDDLPEIPGKFPLLEGEIPQEGGALTRFLEGSNADAFGRGEEVPAIPVEGDPEAVRIEYPSEPVEKPRVSPDVIYTRVLVSSFSDATLPLKGHVGEDPLLPDYFPSYRRGWETGVGGASNSASTRGSSASTWRRDIASSSPGARPSPAPGGGTVIPTSGS